MTLLTHGRVDDGNFLFIHDLAEDDSFDTIKDAGAAVLFLLHFRGIKRDTRSEGIRNNTNKYSEKNPSLNCLQVNAFEIRCEGRNARTKCSLLLKLVFNYIALLTQKVFEQSRLAAA